MKTIDGSEQQQKVVNDNDSTFTKTVYNEIFTMQVHKKADWDLTNPN